MRNISRYKYNHNLGRPSAPVGSSSPKTTRQSSPVLSSTRRSSSSFPLSSSQPQMPPLSRIHRFARSVATRSPSRLASIIRRTPQITQPSLQRTALPERVSSSLLLVSRMLSNSFHSFHRTTLHLSRISPASPALPPRPRFSSTNSLITSHDLPSPPALLVRFNTLIRSVMRTFVVPSQMDKTCVSRNRRAMFMGSSVSLGPIPPRLSTDSDKVIMASLAVRAFVIGVSMRKSWIAEADEGTYKYPEELMEVGEAESSITERRWTVRKVKCVEALCSSSRPANVRKCRGIVQSGLFFATTRALAYAYSISIVLLSR